MAAQATSATALGHPSAAINGDRMIRMTPAPSNSARRAFMTMLGRELTGLHEGFRFRATVALILGLMIASALINAVRYRSAVESYEQTKADYSEELEGRPIADLAVIGHPAVKPPWKLAFLVDGGQSSRPNVYRQPLSPWLEPELESRHSANRRLSPSEPLDWIFLIRVVFSLAAFVLAYDAFCGERQRAVLRMVLSYPVARWHVVAAKLVAIWLGLAVPFIVGIPWCLLILRAYGGLSFSAADWLKIMLVSLLGLWACVVFVLIALLVSALCRESGRSLASLALIWITAVVVMPVAGGLLVRSTRPLVSDAETGARMVEIKEEVEQQDGPGTWRTLAAARAANFDRERDAAETQNKRYASQDEERRKFVESQFQQLQLSRRYASISPMSLIQDLAERVAGSGPYRDHDFQRQAWAFRSHLKDRVKALDAADPDSPHLLFIRFFMSQKTVEPDKVPRFEFRELTVARGLRDSGWHLLALSLATLVLATAVLAAFEREDVG